VRSRGPATAELLEALRRNGARRLGPTPLRPGQRHAEDPEPREPYGRGVGVGTLRESSTF
jgi:hypothetical protein